jgi:hypothetical protein
MSDLPPKQRRRLKLSVFLAVAALAAPITSAMSKLPVGQEEKVGRCIAETAGGRTWLAKTLWGLWDQEGGWEGAKIVNIDGSTDLGPMQINSQWVGRIATLTRRPVAEIRYALVNDACFNVKVASWLFLTALSQSGGYWNAVGAYHSPTAARQVRYAQAVAQRMVARFGATVFAATAKLD